MLKQIPLMPLYWLLISVAAYRALWQFMTARFEWGKTEHGLAKFQPTGPHGSRRGLFVRRGPSPAVILRCEREA